MENPADDPNYDAAASNASRATIFTFFATCIYLFFFSGVQPGLLGGAAFFFGGMFAVSILISMPLFILRTQAPALGLLISIADIAATFFAARFVYLWLFASPELAAGPFEVECDESMPVFTLGYESNPSEAEVDRLCACVFATLSEQDRSMAHAISEGRAGEPSRVAATGFARNFGAAIERCGGHDL